MKDFFKRALSRKHRLHDKADVKKFRKVARRRARAATKRDLKKEIESF